MVICAACLLLTIAFGGSIAAAAQSKTVIASDIAEHNNGVEFGQVNLSAIRSPILFAGDERCAYRDPAAVYHSGMFFLYFTFVEIEEDGRVYSYTAMSTSRDLAHWSDKRIITPKDQSLNYCAPGNVIRFGGRWVLCLQTYPRPGARYTGGQRPPGGDKTSRVFVMTSDDLVDWSPPRLLKVKGPDVAVADMGRMIDPFLFEDKDEPGKWWCFYKQNGVSMSWSRDLETWTYFGRADSGENVCVLVEDNAYFLFHSPQNGIGIKRSMDLKHWQDVDDVITLGQKDWSWAKGRLTAGFVMDMRKEAGIGKYIMFFHGSGPECEKVNFDKNASIGIAWSDDLVTWNWPGKYPMACHIHTGVSPEGTVER